MISSIIIINSLNTSRMSNMSKSRYFRIRLFIDCGTISPKCVYDNIHVYTRLYSAKRAARSMALANYPPASWFVNEVTKR